MNLMNSSPHIPFARTHASVHLDLIRGTAALLVCLEHWRQLLYVDYRQIYFHRAFFKMLYAVTGAAHRAVIVFFVLSGYLIGSSIFRLVHRGSWNWPLYMTHRLVRLWIVLLPALLLGAVLDTIGVHLHFAVAPFAREAGVHSLAEIADTLDLGTFAGNLFFLRGIVVGIFGSNGALWSLTNEFWYYVLFPCAILAYRGGRSILARAMHLVIVLLAAWFVGWNILLLFPVWLFGAVIAAIPAPQFGIRTRILAALGYGPVFVLLPKIYAMHGLLSDYVFGFGTAVLLWFLLAAKSAAPANKWVRLTRVTARFSYTLYAVHVPFLVFLTAWIVGESRWQPDARHLLYGVAILGLTIAYAYILASLTEFRTDRVRSWVEEKVLGRQLRAPAGRL
jgi:peptidoglycan/LPS O-acetylase OafA/YrhL